MFKKLFGRKDAPIKDGKTSTSLKVDKVRWVKKFTLNLTNMEGSPSYNLVQQLTVGSEIGNIVIADPSVSPRHCTFVLQEDVVSVLDHGSVNGTIVNGKKIPPGRYIILEETDIILVGDLQVKIVTKSEAVEEGLSDEELEEEIEKTLQEELKEEDLDNIDDVDDETLVEEGIVSTPNSKGPKLSFFKKLFQKKPKEEVEVKKSLPVKDLKNIKKLKVKKDDLSFSANSSYATNSLVRTLAVLCDLLLSYTVFIVLYPFTVFKTFLFSIPVMIGDLLEINWATLWAAFNEDYAFVGEILKDGYEFLSVSFNIVPLIILFVLLRIIGTFLLGVSFSEWALGVRAHGNAIWKRFGGVFRVIIGVLTGPFIIFDVPAIVSRRTLKEFLTFTHTYLTSKFLAILGTILYLPLMLALSLFCPLLEGFELPEPILVNEKLERRMKEVKTDTPAQEVMKTTENSRFFHFDLTYANQNVSLIPLFKFSGQKNKLNYKSSLVFYHREMQRPVQLELMKTFDLRQLLGIGMRGNFFLYEKFPEIYNFVYSLENANPAFKGRNDVKTNRKFADEVVSFTKMCLELSANNAVDFMQTYTPLMKGLIDYRSSLLALLDYKEFDQISFMNVGNAYFLKFSFGRQKPFDLIIPLIKDEGRIYKVEFDKKENLGALGSLFYKTTLNDTNWFSQNKSIVDTETLGPLEVLDIFTTLEMKNFSLAQNKAQALYGYYYEKSADVLKRDDPQEYEIWKKGVLSIFSIMEKIKNSLPKNQPPEIESTPAPVPSPIPGMPGATAPSPAVDEEDARLKLFQNFQDLKDAFENKNKDYFGVTSSVSV